MAHCSDAQIADEWRESVACLSDAVGAPVSVASVPGGYYSRRVGELAARAGIRVLFTSEPTANVDRVGDCMLVGRYTVRRGMPAAAIAALVGDAGRARAIQWLAWNGKKVLKAAGGNAYLRARDLMFGR
jgi:hypothetical protein